MSWEEAVPEIEPADLAGLLGSDAEFVLLDVREPWELRYARLDDPRLVLVPLSQLGRAGLTILPAGLSAAPDSRIVVLCHHGIRSAEVTAWMRRQGFTNVLSLRGGIDAYARTVDARVGLY